MLSIIELWSLDETFKRIDADKTDSLNFDEFLHSDLPYEQLKQEEFKQLDTDRKSHQTLNELNVQF